MMIILKYSLRILYVTSNNLKINNFQGKKKRCTTVEEQHSLIPGIGENGQLAGN